MAPAVVRESENPNVLGLDGSVPSGITGAKRHSEPRSLVRTTVGCSYRPVPRGPQPNFFVQFEGTT